jgi:hypothetical protein
MNSPDQGDGRRNSPVQYKCSERIAAYKVVVYIENLIHVDAVKEQRKFTLGSVGPT